MFRNQSRDVDGIDVKQRKKIEELLHQARTVLSEYPAEALQAIVERGREWQTGIRGLVQQLGLPGLSIVQRPPWKTIRLGTMKSGALCAKEILFAGGLISKAAQEVLFLNVRHYPHDALGSRTFQVAKQLVEIDLALVSLAELDFHRRAPREQVHDRAIHLGLELCPAEVGPQLRLQYMDQPRHEALFIATRPLEAEGFSPQVLIVRHDDKGLWLDSGSDRSDMRYDPDSLWVFCRPKQEAA